MQSIDNVLKLRKGLKPDDPNPDIFDILWAKKLSGAAKDYTVTGNPLSFLAKKAQTAKSTKVTLEPVQDLHGYDNPWPAGGGKNMFDEDTVLENYKTSDGFYFNEPILVIWNNTNNLSKVYVKCTIKQETSGYGIRLRFEYSDNTTENINLDNKTTWFTGGKWSNSNKTLSKITIFRGNNINGYIKDILISTTETDYVPYSNICPISGRSSVEINGCGKNKFDYDESKVTVCETSTGTIRSYHPTGITNCTITFSAYLIDSSSVTNTFINVGKLVNGKLNVISTFLSTNGDITNRTVTFAEGEEAVLMSASSEVSGITLNLPKYNIQLELGSTATDYEPYAESNDVTITFGETVYGGTLDMDTGILTVNKANIDLGSLTWAKIVTVSNKHRFSTYVRLMEPSTTQIICSNYPRTTSTYRENLGIQASNNNIYIYDSSYEDTSESDFKIAMNGVQLVYELAEPTTIQLTPEQIQILKGENHIWIEDEGATIALTYKK